MVCQEEQQPVTCFRHLTFLKCANQETRCLPLNTYTCPKHQYMFDAVRQKLSSLCSKPVDRCYETNGLCFFNFATNLLFEASSQDALPC